jgi:hypothetical protein
VCGKEAFMLMHTEWVLFSPITITNKSRERASAIMQIKGGGREFFLSVIFRYEKFSISHFAFNDLRW